MSMHVPVVESSCLSIVSVCACMYIYTCKPNRASACLRQSCMYTHMKRMPPTVCKTYMHAYVDIRAYRLKQSTSCVTRFKNLDSFHAGIGTIQSRLALSSSSFSRACLDLTSLKTLLCSCCPSRAHRQHERRRVAPCLDS